MTQTYMGIALQIEKDISYKGRLWGVHRLDWVTSVVLIFAKSEEVAQELAVSFREKAAAMHCR